MHASFRVFWDAKIGSSPEEYEDAFWPEAAATFARDGRFAVADGATESSYSRHWAQLLVGAVGGQGYTRRETLIRHLDELRTEWSTAHVNPSQPWYVAQKLELGAFAALLGVRLIEDARGPRYHAIAAGDCCLVVVRDGAQLRAWPVEQSTDFGSNPILLSSVDPAAEQRAFLLHDAMPLATGDTLFLMSDALAAWFLREAEAGRVPWATVGAFESGDDEGFRAWVRELREAGAMRNDDVTVALVAIE